MKASHIRLVILLKIVELRRPTTLTDEKYNDKLLELGKFVSEHL